MASLPTRVVASFDAIKPVPNLTGLDGEFNQLEGASGILNGGTNAFKLLIKSSDGADPPVDSDQIGAGLLARWKQNGSSKATITNDGSLTANGLTGAAGVYTFGSIPIGPASDPSSANQLTRKSYVDAKTVSFAASFRINDPSTATVGGSGSGNDFGTLVIPSGGTYTITKFSVAFHDGSHTAGGSLTFQVFQFGVGVKSTAALKLDNTNNAGNTLFFDDIGDFTAGAGSMFAVELSARSGTITERNVTVSIEGFRTLI